MSFENPPFICLYSPFWWQNTPIELETNWELLVNCYWLIRYSNFLPHGLRGCTNLVSGQGIIQNCSPQIQFSGLDNIRQTIRWSMPGAVYFHRQLTAIESAGTVKPDRTQVIIAFADIFPCPQDGRTAGLRRRPAWESKGRCWLSWLTLFPLRPGSRGSL